MAALKKRPKIFIQASAIGYYGNRTSDNCSELCVSGDGFLADVCSKWESYVPQMEEILDRVVTVRIGVVLGRDGGMLPVLLKQSRKHLAGIVGKGDQWISWIHIYDLVYAILYLMNDDKARGVFNLTAPAPVQQIEFSHLLQSKSGNKIQLQAPGFVIRIFLGEFGKELLLTGQKASAARLARQGFLFKYNTVEEALSDIIRPYPVSD